MSVARRPLLTATAAGTLLFALWFVPSAKATQEHSSGPERQSVPAAPDSPPAHPGTSAPARPGTSSDLLLTATGSVRTTPFRPVGPAASSG